MELTKWEYKYITSASNPNIFDELATMGLQGWEAVSMTQFIGGTSILLKRPLP